jgi:hypothetical protein
VHRLAQDVDAWVATASDVGGQPHQIPLSYLWDGESFLISTPTASVTGRNLSRTGRVRLGIGSTRDVILVTGTAEPVGVQELTADSGDAFAAKTGFDPRGLAGYLFFRIRPVQIRAWREENELAGRDLMVDGAWLEPEEAAPGLGPDTPRSGTGV